MKNLQGGGFRATEEVLKILTKPEFVSITPLPAKVNLVRLSVVDLGFTQLTPLREIYERAMKFGLSLCHPKVGPLLRLEYPDQPKGRRLRVAMNAILDSTGIPRIFCIEHQENGGKWIKTSPGDLDECWSPNSCFVFIP